MDKSGLSLWHHGFMGYQLINEKNIEDWTIYLIGKRESIKMYFLVGVSVEDEKERPGKEFRISLLLVHAYYSVNKYGISLWHNGSVGYPKIDCVSNFKWYLIYSFIVNYKYNNCV